MTGENKPGSRHFLESVISGTIPVAIRWQNPYLFFSDFCK